LVAKCVQWDLGNALREHADEIGFGLSIEQIEEGKRLLVIAMLRYPMTQEHL